MGGFFAFFAGLDVTDGYGEDEGFSAEDADGDEGGEARAI